MRMAIYAAQIDRMDQNVGKLVDHLQQSGQLENTLIVFLSDNGACAEGGVLGRGPVMDAEARNDNLHASYGMAWANVSSTPYRLYKHYTHEGGTCTPFFMHWPDQIEPQADWYRAPAQLIDIMPTLLGVAGATYPTNYEGRQIIPTEGISLTPAFVSKPIARARPIFLEHESNASVRTDKWKLVGTGVARPRDIVDERWELYDMQQDGTELHDLAQLRPRLAEEMAQQWNSWATRVGVYPKYQRPRATD